MDFTSGRYPLNENKYSIGTYYSTETEKNNTAQLELSNLENTIPFSKYGFTNLRQINDDYADDLSADFDDEVEEKPTDVNNCDTNIEHSAAQFSNNSKPRIDAIVQPRDSYIDNKMTATDDKHSAMDDTNYIVKLEKMSPDATVGVREPVKSTGNTEKKKHGKYKLYTVFLYYRSRSTVKFRY
ncbi:hypothetical protein ACF0H5_020124 [Mactra antiquata]